MKIACEKPLYEIHPGGIEFELTLRQGLEVVRAAGWLTTVFRAFDGRVGIQFQCDETAALPGVNHIPVDLIESYRVLESDWDIETEGDRAAFEDLYDEEIRDLLSDKYSDEYGGSRSWEDLVLEERRSRLAPRYPGWHRNDEMVIYLTLAASTVGEPESTLATRVGGALWAAIRTSNADRVSLAGDLIGLKVDDARFMDAAASIDPHHVARVASSGMFVGLGGERGTSETLRLLTLLQTSLQVPRFF